MKRMVILILALVLALTFAACGEIWGKKDSTEETSSIHSVEKTDGEQSGTAAADSSVPVESLPGESSGEEPTEEPSAGESSDESSGEESDEEPRLSQLELIASLKVGKDILYSDHFGLMCPTEGPRSYCVNEKGDIYIVCGQDHKIIRMNDKKAFQLDHDFHPSFSVVKGDTVYVLGNSYLLYVVDFDAWTEKSYILPNGMHEVEVHYLRIVGDNVCFTGDEDEVYAVTDNGFEKTEHAGDKYTYSGDTLTIQTNGLTTTIDVANKDTGYLGSDETGIYLYEVEFIPNDKTWKHESAVRKYDFEGNMIEYAIFDFSDCVTYPLRPVIYANGNLYLIKCTIKTVDVYKVTLGNADVSHLYDD